MSIWENNLVVLTNMNFLDSEVPAYLPTATFSSPEWDNFVPDFNNSETRLALESMFSILNRQDVHKDVTSFVDDYYTNAHRSFSVSDIVVINGNFYRCDNYGWSDLGVMPEIHFATNVIDTTLI